MPGHLRPPERSRVQAASNRTRRVHRPIIEPFIIDPLQSPLECWRIQVTMSSHHVDGLFVVLLVACQERQLASIRSGSAHIMVPFVCPLVICWFIQLVMSAHQFSVLLVAVVGVLIIQLLQARLTLATWMPLEAGVEELLSRFAAIAMPMLAPTARSAMAATGRIQRRRVVAVAGVVERGSVMYPACARAGSLTRVQRPEVG